MRWAPERSRDAVIAATMAVLLAGCGSLGALTTPDVLPPGRVRVGAELTVTNLPAGLNPDERPPDGYALGAFQAEVGLGRGVQVSVSGLPQVGFGGAIKVRGPSARLRTAFVAGASRYALRPCWMNNCERHEARTAYAGLSAGSRSPVFEDEQGRFGLWPYTSLRAVYLSSRDVDLFDCIDCEAPLPPDRVVTFRRLMPVLAIGVSFGETLGVRLEGSSYFAPRPRIGGAVGLRF